MTREEQLKAMASEINEVSYSGKVWTVDEESTLTIDEYCKYINPSIKKDKIQYIAVILQTCKEKKNKDGSLRTFKKVKIKTDTDWVEFPLSYNGEDKNLKVGDEFLVDTVVIKKETCGEDKSYYVYGDIDE